MTGQNQPRPWTLALFDFLADGEWHPFNEVVEACRKVIPPSMAFRRGETLRTRIRPKGTQNPGPRKVGDESDSIYTGGRAIARSVLDAQIRMKRAERKGDLVRKAPDAET